MKKVLFVVLYAFTINVGITFGMIVIITGIFTINLSLANQSIENIAREGMEKSQGFASSEGSGSSLPNYSRDKAEEEGGNISILDDAEMKSKGHNEMLDADSNSAKGITRDAMNKKTLDGYEKHEIFTKAEKIWEDPISEYERMTREGCKEKINEQKNQYRKKVSKETQYDTELYEESCEKPANNITCEKTLNVSCEATKECEAGGIVLDSIETGLEWEYRYPNMRFGSKEGAWKFDCNVRKGYWRCCEKIESVARFRLRDISEIRAFRLRKVAFDDHAMIKINGHVAYNSWGGYKLEITNREGSKGGDFGLLIDAGYGYGGECFQFHGKDHYRMPDVDLKPYLREGWNEVEMTLVYAQLGQFNIEIEARQQCCTKLTDKWEVRCWEG